MRLDEQQCEDQPVDNVKESVQMMDEPLVEDQVVHGSHVDVQTKEITRANEKIVVQGGENRKWMAMLWKNLRETRVESV